MDEIARVSPAELLVSSEQKAQIWRTRSRARIRQLRVSARTGNLHLVRTFQGQIARRIRLRADARGSRCGWGNRALFETSTAAQNRPSHFAALRCTGADHVLLDSATQANLELVESRGARDASLLSVLDRTITPMGARKLRAWILQPLRDLTELQRRQQMIADLLQEPDLLASIRAELKSIRDIERAAGRLSQASGNARDLVALKTSLQQIPLLKTVLQELIERIAFGRAGSPSTPIPCEWAARPADAPYPFSCKIKFAKCQHWLTNWRKRLSMIRLSR